MIIQHRIGDDVSAEIRRTSDGYTLWWTDYVANEWQESYPTLSIAFARLAVLQHLGEGGWEDGFATSEKHFTQVANQFLAQA